MILKKQLVETAIIVGAAVLLGFTANFINPAGVKISTERPTKEAAADSAFASAGDQAVLTGPLVIDKEQLKKMRAEQTLTLLDARTPDEFQAGHISGAVNVPFELLGDYIATVDALPKDNWVVTYCEGPPCDKAEMLAQELVNMGFQRVAFYEAGLNDWLTSEDVE